MKKSIFKAAMLAVLAMPVFTACELDQYPTTSIPNEQSWEKFSDATNFNIGIHSYIRGICGALLTFKLTTISQVRVTSTMVVQLTTGRSLQEIWAVCGKQCLPLSTKPITS